MKPAMRVSELSDDQATVLSSKAAAHGLTLEDWFTKLAIESETETFEIRAVPLDPRPASVVIAEIMKNVPAEETAKLPRDGASQVDHHVYGFLKRD